MAIKFAVILSGRQSVSAPFDMYNGAKYQVISKNRVSNEPKG